MAARSKRHKKNQVAECVYCGKTRQTTKEHVFPRGLFRETKRPSNPVIVPACRECNGMKAGDDSYIRDMLNVDINCTDHPIVVENLSGTIARSIQKGWSQLAKETRIHALSEPYFTDSGIYLGDAVSVPVNVERLLRWCEYVIRGLYCAQIGGRIPNGYEFDVIRIKNSQRQAALDDWKNLGAAGPFCMGRQDEESEQVVSWTYALDRNDPFMSMWLVWFYQRVFIAINSAPPGLGKAPQAASGLPAQL
jgi:hypothetical protein